MMAFCTSWRRLAYQATHRWCRAFLSDRKIRTVHDGQFSEWFSINAGVPQGSVLSPFLFLVYINDVFEVCDDRAELSLFADDIAVVPAKTGEEGDGKLFKSLVMLHDWSKMWRLDFNAKKSKVLRFSVKRKTKSRVVRKPPFIQQFFLGAEIIERVTQFDYLGLRWQEDGQWHLHTAKVCTAAKRVSYLITSVACRDGPKLPVIRQLVHALVRTKLSYGMPVWRANTERMWQTMDVITTDPMRICLRLPKSSFVKSILAETNTLPMKLQHEMSLANLQLRVQSLADGHSTRELYEEQAESKVLVKKRTPVFHAAARVVEVRELDLSKLNRKLMLAKFTVWQRVEWNKTGQGKLLRKLTKGGYDAKEQRFRPPRYLFADSNRVAAVRAKLRFDRTNLKDTLSRQHIIKAGQSVLCDCCKYRTRESLWHLLFVCSEFKLSRKQMKADAQKAGISAKTICMREWLLGDLDGLDPSLHSRALTISARFLKEVDRARPL
jgi:hypothetical protein